MPPVEIITLGYPAAGGPLSESVYFIWNVNGVVEVPMSGSIPSFIYPVSPVHDKTSVAFSLVKFWFVWFVDKLLYVLFAGVKL